MQGVFFYLLPARGGRRRRTLLLPDEDATVVGARCKDVAVLRVRPCNLPDRTRVPMMGRTVAWIWRDGHSENEHANELKCMHRPLQRLPGAALRCAVNDVENSNSAIRGTCRESLAVVIQLRIMLHE